MPSINEIMERVSRTKPAVGVDSRDMARWLIELDGQIYREQTHGPLVQYVTWSLPAVKPGDPPRGWVSLDPSEDYTKPHKYAVPTGPLEVCPVCGAPVVWDAAYGFNSCPTCTWTDSGRLPPMKWPEDGDKPLLIDAPYDSIYDYWLISHMEFMMREYGNYNNTASMFASALESWKVMFRRTNRPAQKGGFKNILY